MQKARSVTIEGRAALVVVGFDAVVGAHAVAVALRQDFGVVLVVVAAVAVGRQLGIAGVAGARRARFKAEVVVGFKAGGVGIAVSAERP